MVELEIRQLGAALADASPDYGALAPIEAAFTLYGVGMATTAETKNTVQAYAAKVRSSLAAWDAGRSFMNFTERHADPSELFDATTYKRLQQVKA